MAMMAYDERRILEMLHEDEISRHRAFEAIVRNFSEQLYWQIRHMVLSHDDANDILQNTFIKAWTNLDSFQDIHLALSNSHKRDSHIPEPPESDCSHRDR